MNEAIYMNNEILRERLGDLQFLILMLQSENKQLRQELENEKKKKEPEDGR